jgi:hypothetical protein
MQSAQTSLVCRNSISTGTAHPSVQWALDIEQETHYYILFGFTDHLNVSFSVAKFLSLGMFTMKLQICAC